jgi:protein Tex
VHQDGLVHISMMSHKFIKDPRELVKAGDVLKVKVLEVDLQRKRIALTMKLDAPPAYVSGEQQVRDRQPNGGNRPPSRDGRRDNRGSNADSRGSGGGNRNSQRGPAPPRESQSNGAMAEAWAQALKGR